MSLSKLFLAATFALAVALPASAQHPAVTIDGKDVTMRGCVAPAGIPLPSHPNMLVWSRAGILTAGAAAAVDPVHAAVHVDPGDLAQRVLYWVKGDELAQHVGHMVEIRGDLEDFERGEVEIEREEGFTEIKLKLDGKTEEIRVPTSWLQHDGHARAAADRDRADDIEFEFVARKVDVDEVKVIGRCR